MASKDALSDRNSSDSARWSIASQLNPYSCLACRKQKKRCSRVYPCVNCQKKEIECVFAPRKKSIRGRDALVGNKLARLEATVKCLRSQVDAAASLSAVADDVQTSHFQKQFQGPGRNFDQEFGRLVSTQGRSRYVACNSWANIHNESQDREGLLRTQPSKTRGPSSAFLFATSSHDLAPLHPPGIMLPVYWHIYKENYDRLVKILHIPTTEPLIFSAAASLDDIEPSAEPLLFAIYFGAVVSLPPEECVKTFGHPKSELFSRYNFAVQQSFTQVGLLETNEFIVLQAFTIYLTALRLRCNLTQLSTLTTLAVRLAQNAGIHRDGSLFGLSPFETEMRRRLWWNIRAIDARASEDSGQDFTVRPETSNTKMPINVDDADLTPYMTLLPRERVGYTDMVFSIVRFEATLAFEQLQSIPMGSPGKCGKLHIMKALESKAQCIGSYQDRIQQLVLAKADPSSPFYWYTAIVSRIMLTKLYLIAYYPYLQLDVCGGISLVTRDELFSKAICIVQSQLLLHNGMPTRKWGWFCATHVQWYAITYILMELRKRTHGDRVEAAWVAVNAVFDYGSKATIAAGQETGVQFNTYSQLGQLQEGEHQLLNKLLAAARSAKANARSPGNRSVSIRRLTHENLGTPIPLQNISHCGIERFYCQPVFGNKSRNSGSDSLS